MQAQLSSVFQGKQEHNAADMQALIILTTALLRAASITEVHAVETLGASQG